MKFFSLSTCFFAVFFCTSFLALASSENYSEIDRYYVSLASRDVASSLGVAAHGPLICVSNGKKIDCFLDEGRRNDLVPSFSFWPSVPGKIDSLTIGSGQVCALIKESSSASQVQCWDLRSSEEKSAIRTVAFLGGAQSLVMFGDRLCGQFARRALCTDSLDRFEAIRLGEGKLRKIRFDRGGRLWGLDRGQIDVWDFDHGQRVQVGPELKNWFTENGVESFEVLSVESSDLAPLEQWVCRQKQTRVSCRSVFVTMAAGKNSVRIEARGGSVVLDQAAVSIDRVGSDQLVIYSEEEQTFLWSPGGEVRPFRRGDRSSLGSVIQDIRFVRKQGGVFWVFSVRAVGALSRVEVYASPVVESMNLTRVSGVLDSLVDTVELDREFLADSLSRFLLALPVEGSSFFELVRDQLVEMKTVDDLDPLVRNDLFLCLLEPIILETKVPHFFHEFYSDLKLKDFSSFSGRQRVALVFLKMIVIYAQERLERTDFLASLESEVIEAMIRKDYRELTMFLRESRQEFLDFRSALKQNGLPGLPEVLDGALSLLDMEGSDE